MGILDDLINSNRSSISNNAQASLNRVNQAVDNSYNMNSGGQVSNVDNEFEQQGSENSVINSANDTLGYLQQKQQEYKDLQNQQGVFSYSNMEENGPLTSALANGLSLGGRALATVANAGVGASAYVARKGNDLALTGIPRSLINAYDRQQRGEQISDYEKSALNSRFDGNIAMVNNADNLTVADMIRNHNETNKSIDGWAGNQNENRDNFLGTSQWYSHRNEDQFNELNQGNRDKANTQWNQAKQNYSDGNYLDAIGNTLGAAGTITSGTINSLENKPSYIADLVAGSAPFMAKGLTVPLSILDAARVGDEGESQFRERNKVSLPTAGQSAGIAGMATAYGALNYASGMNLRSASGLERATPTVASALEKDAVQATTKTAQDVAQAQAQQAVANSPVRDMLGGALGLTAKIASPITGAVAHVGKHALSEGATESVQTQIENNWANLNPDIDLVGALEGGTLGAAMGGTISVPGSAVHGVKGVAEKVGEALQDRYVEKNLGSPNATTEDLTNPDSSDYAPHKAINRAVIEAQQQAKDNGSDVDYDQIKSQVDTIKAKSDADVKTARDLYTQAQDPDAFEASVQKSISTIQARLEDAKENDPGKVDQYQALLDKYVNGTEDQNYENSAANRIAKARDNANNLDDLKAYLDQATESNNQAQQAHDNFMESYNKQKVWQQNQQAKANQDDDNSDNDQNGSGTQEQSTSTTDEATQNTDTNTASQDTKTRMDNIFNAPSIDHLSDIDDLLKSGNVSDSDAGLLRTLRDSIVAENQAKSSKDVSKGIRTGTKGKNGDNDYVGVSQYIAQAYKANQANNTAALDNIDYKLTNLHQDQTAKLDGIKQAQEIADSTGEYTQLLRNKDGSWKVAQGSERIAKWRNNGGLTVNPTKPDGSGGTGRLQSAMQSDINAVAGARSTIDALRQGSDNKTTFADPTSDLSTEFGNITNSSSSEATDGVSNANVQADTANVEPNAQDSTTSTNNGSSESTEPTTANPKSADPNVKTTYHTYTNDAGTPKVLRVSRNASNGDIQLHEADVGSKDFKESKVSPTDLINTENNNDIAQEVLEDSKAHTSPNAKSFSNYENLSDKALTKLKSKVGSEVATERYLKSMDRVNNAKKLGTQGAMLDKVNSEAIKAFNILKEHGIEPTSLNVGKPSKPKETVQDKSNTVAKEAINVEVDQTTTKAKGEEVEHSSENLESTSDNDHLNETDEVTSETPDVSSEYVEQPTTTTVEPTDNSKVDSSPEGAISVLNTDGSSYKNAIAKESAKPIKEQNLVTSGFVQRLIKGKNSPLVIFKDYLTEHGDKTLEQQSAEIIKQVTGQDATQGEVEAFADFLQFHDSVYGTLKSAVNQREAKYNEYRYEAFAPFLLNEDGKLDDNIVSALAVAMHSYLASAPSTLFNTNSSLSTILGLKNHENFNGATLARFNGIGTYQNTLVESLGSEAMKALQIRGIKENVGANRSEKLQRALGVTALFGLMAKGYVERTAISTKELANYKALELDPSTFVSNATYSPKDERVLYVRPKSFAVERQGSKYLQYQVAPEVKQIADTSARSGAVVNRVFDVNTAILPSTDKLKFVPATFNEFGSVISNFQRNVLIRQQTKTSYQLNRRLVSALNNMRMQNNEAVLDLLGSKDPNTVIAGRRDSVYSVNEGIERSLNNLDVTDSLVGDNPFYLPNKVWSQNRMGITSIFNPQGDKLHRAMSSLTSDTSAVPSKELQGAYQFGEKPNLDKFLIALSLRLEDIPGDQVGGLNSIDKSLNASYLPAMHDLINRGDVVEAAMALNSIAENKYTTEDVNKVSNLLNNTWQGETGAGGLSALQAIADYHIAKDKGTNLVHTIFGESDGSNNGPAIINTLYGVLKDNISEPSGLFKVTSESRNLSEFRANGGSDLYQQLGNTISRLWNEYANYSKDHDLTTRAINAINLLDPKVGTRTWAKSILVPFNYGSGVDATVKSVGKAMIGSIYSQLEKAVNSNNREQVNNLVNAMNIAMDQRTKIDPRSVNINFQLTPQQEANLLRFNSELRGDVIDNGLNELLSDFIQKRNTSVALANSSYTLFEPLYKQALAKAESDFAKANPDKVAVGENMSAQDKADVLKDINDYLPTLAVPMGMESNQGKESGIPLANLKKGYAEDESKLDSANVIRPKFNGSPEQGFTPKSSNGIGFKKSGKTTTLNTALAKVSLDAPGVSSMAKYVQSHDAYITAKMMAKYYVQNFHDANAVSASKLAEMAKYQNQVFFEAMTKSHMGKTFTDALMMPLRAYADGTLAPTKENKSALLSTIKALNKTYFGDGESANINELLTRIANEQYANDINKLNGLKDIKYVNQYATEGSEYTPTSNDMARIDKELESLYESKEALSNEITKLVPKLNEFLSGKNTDNGSGKVTGSTKSISQSFQDEMYQNRASITDANKLVNFLKSQYAKVKTPNYLMKAHQSILSMVPNALANVKVEVMHISEVHKIKDPTLRNYINEGNFAWYNSTENNGDGKITLVMGTSNPIRSEIIVHELHHAMTVRALNKANSKDASPAAKKALENIKSLREEFGKQLDMGSDYMLEYANSDIYEFVTMGLTDKTTMDTLANMQVKYNPVGKLAKLTNGLKAMVTATLDLIKHTFNKPVDMSNGTTTALEALSYEVADLLNTTYGAEGGFKRGEHILKNNFGAPFEKAQDAVANMKSSEVFNNLTDNSDPNDPHKAMLSSFMNSHIDQLFSFKKEDPNYTVDDIWNDALQSGEAPHATDALNAGYKLDAKEQFAVEAIELAMQDSVNNNSTTIGSTELTRVYKEARDRLEPKDFYQGHWSQASVNDKAVAQAKYDYLFDSKNPNHLSRFTSLAIGSKEVNELLNMQVKDPSLDVNTGNKAFEAVVHTANSALALATGKLTGVTKGSLANSRVERLARKLISVERKNRNKATNALQDSFEKVEGLANQGLIQGSLKVYDIANKARINERNRAQRFVRDAVKATAGGKPFEAFKVYGDMINESNPNKTLGFLGELNNEISKPSEEGRSATQLMRDQKLNETNAQRIRVSLSNAVNESFKNNANNIDKASKKAMTDVLLRGDVQHLLDTHGINDIYKLITDSTYLNQEINKYIKGLDPVHAMRAHQLGNYMATGDGHNTLAKSAYSIASNLGMSDKIQGEPDPKVVNQIDTLASLYAMKYQSKDAKDKVAKVMDSEKSNNGYGGVTDLLKFHQSLVEDSKTALFSNTPHNYSKGYVPDVTNPHKDIVIARTAEDANRLRNAYYKELRTLSKDPQDPNSDIPIMFYTDDSEQQNVVSGAFTLYNYGRKGSEVDLGAHHVSSLQSKFEADLRKQNPYTYNPKSTNGAQMIPNYDGSGNLKGYSYEMNHYTKDTYLDREGDFAHNIGVATARGYSKLANFHQNMNVVNALYDDYYGSKNSANKKFVYVSYNSKDPVAQEAWSRLPRETKELIKEKWGNYGMWVANDAFLTVFGYTKLNATNIFDKDENVRNVAENMFVHFMSALFGKNARSYTSKGHSIWQEAVKLFKNIVVLRNVTTAVNNFTANNFVLAAHGVPMQDIIKNNIKAMRGGIQYRKDMALVTKLEARQRAGIGDLVSQQNEIDRLHSSIANNPMNDFISKGMNPGIVEDIDDNQDRYSYQSQLADRFSTQYNKLPSLLRKTTENLLVTPSTPLYQFLHSATQYSDFAAKYTLYKHLKSKGVDDTKALNVASDNFIDYDVPSSKYLQYANDMGLVMFTKYNLRIQKALFSLIAKRPASAIGQALLMHYTSNAPYALDPIVFNQIGNPFRFGPLNLLDAWDEPFPLKVLLG
jgi:hypothetical protein